MTVVVVPPEQIGSVGLVVQVAMMVVQPVSVGVAVHWANEGVVPVLVHAPGLAAQRAAQPAREGLAEH